MKSSISISKSLISQLNRDYHEIRQKLVRKGYSFDQIPQNKTAISDVGEAFSLAYPVQGLLKYHGFSDSKEHIAYFPSISLNNGCLFTVSYLKFDKSLNNDVVFLNGSPGVGETYQNVKNSLDYIRNFSGIKTKAILVSRNYSPSKVNGKGLGTSASGSAALAIAATSIIYDNNPEFMNNRRLVSIFSRYLSGSGCRSSSGEISLWLSYPNINPLDSFAINLIREEHQKFIKSISLLTIPIKSAIKTTQAHKIAPKSPFFEAWLLKRKELVLEFLEGLDNHDLKKVGDLSEFDTLCLHAVAMTAPNDQNIIAWSPDTLKVILGVRELRKNGYEVYYSIDTGPSLVLLTKKSQAEEIYKEIKMIIPNHEIIKGSFGGPSRLLDLKSPEIKILEADIAAFIEK
ncbi:MAG: diphosphomevalonate/mevalonate 3,5-bisphosphate decarboxylase family protein [Candidatus Hermodarchaeota archaeon]